MQIKITEAISLYNIVSQLNISALKDDKEKLALIRLSIELKKFAEQWNEIVTTANSMDPQASNSLLQKEAETLVDINEDLLISQDSADQLAIANATNMVTGALTYILRYLPKP